MSTLADFPSPATETSFPAKGWIWRARYRVYASAVDDQNIDPVRVEKDIRSKRELVNARIALITINTDNQGMATAITLTGIIRQLFLV